MVWNWQQLDWPQFSYEELSLVGYDNKLLLGAGILLAAFKYIDEEKNQFTIDLISSEALKTSEIEGEYLDGDSLQSSMRRQVGLALDNRKILPAELGIAQAMVDLYQEFKSTLSHANRWRDLNDITLNRTRQEPTQIIHEPL